jgi:predicted metal-dependent HD superfamily phosphohydrolase
MRIDSVLQYMERGRSYHTFQHISDMFRTAYEHRISLTRAQKIAIVYHDAVYKPGRKDNEEKSVACMYRDEWGVEKEEHLEIAEKIILSTRHHFPLHRQARDVIDLDLYNLTDFWRYLDTYEKVKEEYSKLDEDKWIKGRVAWLKEFLKRDQIYWGFLKGCDSDARANLIKELKKHGEPVEDFMDRRQRKFVTNILAVPNEDGVVRED